MLIDGVEYECNEHDETALNYSLNDAKAYLTRIHRYCTEYKETEGKGYDPAERQGYWSDIIERTTVKDDAGNIIRDGERNNFYGKKLMVRGYAADPQDAWLNKKIKRRACVAREVAGVWVDLKPYTREKDKFCVKCPPELDDACMAECKSRLKYKTKAERTQLLIEQDKEIDLKRDKLQLEYVDSLIAVGFNKDQIKALRPELTRVIDQERS